MPAVNNGATSLDYQISGYYNSPHSASWGTGGLLYHLGAMREAELEEITLNLELNPKLWNSKDELIPVVREKLLGIAKFFIEDLGLYTVKDIRITGSEANYNYNEFSDIDLHIVYDFEKLGVDTEILQDYFKAKKDIFNSEYSFMIRQIPVEVGVEDINNPIVAEGIYSLTMDTWIKKPSNAGLEITDVNQSVLDFYIQKVENAIESKNKQTILDTWAEIKKLRKNSLASNGEFAQGNLIFKHLRNKKYISRLKSALDNIISIELSLESKKEI